MVFLLHCGFTVGVVELHFFSNSAGAAADFASSSLWLKSFLTTLEDGDVSVRFLLCPSSTSDSNNILRRRLVDLGLLLTR